jgi:hypothetical protein
VQKATEMLAAEELEPLLAVEYGRKTFLELLVSNAPAETVRRIAAYLERRKMPSLCVSLTTGHTHQPNRTGRCVDETFIALSPTQPNLPLGMSAGTLRECCKRARGGWTPKSLGLCPCSRRLPMGLPTALG